jgi:hypothetical protein
VNLEIFLAAGAFCDEVLAFARVQRALRFIVMGWPEEPRREPYPGCAEALKSLHQHITGEILLGPPGKSDPIDRPLRRVLGSGFWVLGQEKPLPARYRIS